MRQFTRIVNLHRQLSVGRFLGHMAAIAVQKLLDRYVIPSYSQYGEDRVIESLFPVGYAGYYVDVGCNHPVSYSNTWKLYLKGWSGLVIDANSELVALYDIWRPRDKAITEAVSNVEESVDFYFSRKTSLISGIGKKQSSRWPRNNSNSDVVKLQSKTLDRLLMEQEVPTDFDFLNIDVEGHECEVLESITFKRYIPKVLAVEIHDLRLPSLYGNAVFRKLWREGYELVAYLGPTGIFKKIE